MSAQNPSATTTTTSSTDSMSNPSRKRSNTMSTGAAVAIAIVLLLIGIGGGYFLGMSVNKGTSSTSKTTITETGSSLLYPLMESWGPNYTSYNPNVILAPASTGSGTGQADAEGGLINIGASDGYLANASATNLINVPVAISSQLIWYNLPGVTGHLNLNGTVLAMIYSGDITTWNNPWILAANPAQTSELNGLASEQIWTVKRADSSGDTFLFSSYCQMSWSGWTYGSSTSALSGLSGAHVIAETGNSGMVTGVTGQVGAVAYIGISYKSDVTGSGLGYAALGDNNSLSASGGVDQANYVLWSPANVSTDVSLGLTHLNFASYGLAVTLIMGGSPYGAVTIVTGGGGTTPLTGSTPYPIVNLEYSLIKTTAQTNSQAIVLFLEWAISYGNLPQYLNPIGFVPLTPTVAGYVMQELATVA
jgi:phosphate transport system substrate-binding protein